MSWMHYNPHRADPALLDRITSGEARIQLRDALLDVIESEADRASHQHQLLIGARGAGKTHLLRVVAHRIAITPDLERRWRPVILPEEQGIRGPSELFGALVGRLASDLESSELAAARTASAEAKQMIGKARGETAMRLGFDGLKRIAAALDRKILAVVENLDALFFRGVGGGKKEADAEQWQLRKYLQDADFLLLLGAAPTYFGAASDQGAAFHGFFQQHSLDALELDEVIHIAREHLQLVAHEGTGARAARAGELLDRFEANRGRLAGMLRVTGGLPRFAHLIVDLLLDSEDADAETQLERLLDEQTPYFQGRLDPRLIPPAELEILATLARATGPLRPSELARRVGGQTGEASVLLERLRERGLARRSGNVGGAVAWDVAEPLYRVWMAFREGGEQRSAMVALTEMVAALYSADELLARAEAGSTEGDTESVWTRALTRGPSLDDEPEGPGQEEANFQAASAALTAAEAKGMAPPKVVIRYVDTAWRTGRRALGEARIDIMLERAADHGALRAKALLVAAQYGGPAAAAHAATAAALFERVGRTDGAFTARGREGEALMLSGNPRAAFELLAATYQTALDRQPSSDTVSWLAVLTAVSAPTQELSRQWGTRARDHARPNSVNEANALRILAKAATTADERLALRTRAAEIYEVLGMHDDLGGLFIAQCDESTAAGDLESGCKKLADAVDLFLEHDAVLAVDVWGRLHDFAVWGPRSVALLALHELAACVNNETVRATAEPQMLAAAVSLIAARAHAHEELLELLETARDDLLRERRTLLEPFVLAARVEAEGEDAALFEQSEPMRAVVADVVRRIGEARAKPTRRRPAWAADATGGKPQAAPRAKR